MLSSYACLEKQDLETNQRWFYALSVQPTLFGGWSLMREWGRTGCAGQVKVDWHTNQEAAEAAFGHQVREKKRQGYRSQ